MCTQVSIDQTETRGTKWRDTLLKQDKIQQGSDLQLDIFKIFFLDIQHSNNIFSL